MSEDLMRRLGLQLDFGVQLRLLELKAMPEGRRRLQCDWDLHVVRENWPAVDERTDLLFGSAQLGAVRTRKDFQDSARVVHLLTLGLAVMAQQPGGVTAFGRHWCTDHMECERAAEQAARLVEADTDG